MAGDDTNQNAGESKLIIDSDWKSEAQAEKDKLSADAEKTKAAQEQQAPPPANITGLIQMLVEPALLYLGRIPEPSSGKPIVSLEAAKYYIDLLGVLEEHTRGNVTAEEQELMAGTVRELQSEFVEVSRLVAQAIKEGKAQTVGPGGQPSAGAGGAGGSGTGGIITPG